MAQKNGSHSQRQMSEYTAHIAKRVGDLKGKEVLIVGDVGVDEYVFGQVRRISPEAPVPVLEVDNEEARLGLAANVAQNVSSLGGVPRLVGVAGQDSGCEQLRKLLAAARVSPEHLVIDSSRPTTRKLRVMVENHHIVRVDYEKRHFLSREVEDRVIKDVQALMKNAAAVIVQDYAKGVISERLVTEVVKAAHAAGKKVLVDPHRTTPLATYRGVDLMTPNYDESVALTGVLDDEHRKEAGIIDRIGSKLMEVVGAQNMVVTLGKEGMRLFEGGNTVELPTNAKQVSDVTGAGDTVIAALALAWGSGFTLEQSCALANFAAGVVVGKVGCVPCTVDELLAAISECQ
ncbi:MAG TPA: D-glycero-beta-D-manno-heptose-7-phosphate kinase [Bdellovibrionales bacterium]|nr:D-glycero-beta-D-manno-heptose-7-phosphate kinase [Bdellovibrionales bacterium]